MENESVLEALYQGDLTAQNAYDSLYPLIDKKKLKRARFVKMKINVKEEDSKATNIFLSILFFFPIPLFIARMLMRIAMKKGQNYVNLEDINQTNDFDMKTLIELSKYAKGTSITVESDDADVNIKIF